MLGFNEWKETLVNEAVLLAKWGNDILQRYDAAGIRLMGPGWMEILATAGDTGINGPAALVREQLLRSNKIQFAMRTNGQWGPFGSWKTWDEVQLAFDAKDKAEAVEKILRMKLESGDPKSEARGPKMASALNQQARDEKGKEFEKRGETWVALKTGPTPVEPKKKAVDELPPDLVEKLA